MSTLNIKKVAVSGHRVLKKDFDKAKLADILQKLILQNYLIFYIGMARGFDLACFKELLQLKIIYTNVKIIACVPCANQDRYYSIIEREAYKNYLNLSDEVIVLNDRYINGCMQQRNRYMVDNSDTLFTYIYKNNGGTFYTLNYAKQKDKQIIFY